jgi:YD repeat-containing protein
LIVVREDPATLAYDTYYTYDTLDDLSGTRQAGTCANGDPVASPCTGGTARSFTYTSLKRLATALNPESGPTPTQYTYDANGNLSTRTDARLTATLTYDDLNRPLTRSYSDSTPPVQYVYDQADTAHKPDNCVASDGAVGRLASAGNSVSTNYYYYDKLGHFGCHRQATGTAHYDFHYQVTPQGEFQQIVYPSTRTVNTARNDRGLPVSVGSYATGIVYEAHGGLKQTTLGNGVVESWTYNSRLQPASVQAGSLMTLQYGYPATQNNGNLASQTIVRGAQQWVQSYGYDGVNRLGSASESGPGTAWSETYGYDARGNRWQAGHTGLPDPSLETPVASSWYDGNNRIVGWGYDGSGNVQSVYGMSRGFVYDGENRQTSATVNGSATSYAYDGEGRRVTKTAGGETTTYMYDAMGQLAAEYTTGTPAGSGTQYLATDHLGSTRLVMDQTGAAVRCYDYRPFGEEVGSGTDGRGSCFGADAVRDCQEISVSTLGEQAIVPVAVKDISPEAEFRHLFVGDLDTRWVGVWIEATFYSQTGLGGCGGDEVDDDLMADQRLAPPVLTDEREQPVFDLVPLAGARRKMADRNLQSGFVG